MLEIRSVVKRFGDALPVVREVNLNIRRGEFFSLLGPSGCGKTTLLRMIGGFEAPTSGEISFDGRRVDPLPPNERHFNMVFQRYALFPHLSVHENIAFGLRMRRGSERVAPAEIKLRVLEMLALVKLDGLAERDIATLSGGQQQRVALARALINRPEVLLLDEPLSALDLKLRQQMQVELIGLQKRLGHTFIYVTHDQEEALTLSDRIAVMNDGRIEQVGTPREIYEEPATEFVARFIGTTNALNGWIVGEAPGDRQLEFAWAGRRWIAARPRSVTGNALARSGQPATLLIRPENLQLGPLEAAAWAPKIGDNSASPAVPINRLEGELLQVLYQGPYTQYFVIPDGAPPKSAPWIVHQANHGIADRPSFTNGARVLLQWSARDGRVISAPAADGLATGELSP